MSIVYKVCRESSGRFYSTNVLEHDTFRKQLGLSLEYSLGVTTTPVIKYSKLFAFDNYRDAYTNAKYSGWLNNVLTILRCETESYSLIPDDHYVYMSALSTEQLEHQWLTGNVFRKYRCEHLIKSNIALCDNLTPIKILDSIKR